MNAEKETLDKIKFMLECNNEASAIRVIEQYGHYRHEQALQLQQGDVSGSFPNQCACSFNHGTNCFTGNCTVCGLRKDNYVKQEKSYSEKDMIESAKYGYEYHATTSFPDKSFENNCKNNFLQHLFAKFGKNYR